MSQNPVFKDGVGWQSGDHLVTPPLSTQRSVFPKPRPAPKSQRALEKRPENRKHVINGNPGFNTQTA